MSWKRLTTIQAVRAGLTLLAAISVALWASSVTAATTITQSTCPVVIAQSGEYDLGTDVGPCLPGVDGIDIFASDVTLHLDGHTITGTTVTGTCNTSFGIRVGLPVPAPMISQVRVLGEGTISNFRVGFRARNSAGSFVKFTTVTAQCPFFSFGFLIQGPESQWKLEGNVVREPGNNSSGIFVFGGDDNELVRNDVNDTIALATSNNNTIVNNTANDNEGGIVVGSPGFGPSNNNEIHANTTNNNTIGGGLTITLDSTGNNVTGNTAFNNLPFDMEDDNPNCDANKWKGNHFNTANQSCIQ